MSAPSFFSTTRPPRLRSDQPGSLNVNDERDDKRQTIRSAAIQIFAERGFANTRTREIAAAAGVAEGTIYLYFDSKEELLLDAFRERVTTFCDSARALIDSGDPFADRMTRFVERQFSAIEADPALASVLLVESRMTARFYKSAVRDVLRDYAAAVEDLLRSGIRQRALAADLNVTLARRLLIGSLEEVELDWLVSSQNRKLSAMAPEVSSLLIRGFRGPTT